MRPKVIAPKYIHTTTRKKPKATRTTNEDGPWGEGKKKHASEAVLCNFMWTSSKRNHCNNNVYVHTHTNYPDLKQNEVQSVSAESTHKGVN